MKLKLIAAAAALAFAGAANAAIDNGQTGNGSLLANVSFGNASSGSSATFDLGLSFTDVATWQASINSTLGSGGTEWFRAWDLGTGTLSGTGISTSVIGNYGSTLADFNAAATAAGATGTAQLNLFAFDGTGVNPGERSIYVTGNGINNTTGAAATLTAPTNTIFNGLQTGTTVTNFLVGVNNAGTHATDGNGAHLASAGSSAYFNNGTGMERLANTGMFDTNGQYNGNYSAGATTFAGMQKAIPFYQMIASSITGTQRASLSAIGYDMDGDGVIEFDNNGAALGGSEYGLWTLEGNVLKFSVAAVPEPESYAMLLAGLGLMGAIARRRKKSA
jgi:hypothetical protein